jgi:hypothetical protein
VINYHNMIASVSDADANLWSHALSKWDPQKADLSESFFSPSDDLIERCKAEKRKAALLASDCLSSIHNQRKYLSRTEYESLRCYFEKLLDTAELWSHLVELYLLHRQMAFSPPKPDRIAKAVSSEGQVKLQRLVSAADAAIRKAVGMEHRHGKNSWPVFSPDRGGSAYQFVHEVLRYYIGAVTEEPSTDKVQFKLMDTVVTAPQIKPDSTESFWRQFVEWGRPDFQYEENGEVTLHWPQGLRELRLTEGGMTLFGHGARTLVLPLPFPVEEASFAPARALSLKVRKTVSRLTVERRSANQEAG